MSAIAPSLRTALAEQLAQMDAALAPAPPKPLRLFADRPGPVEPAVAVPIRVANEALTALRRYTEQLEAAARATHGPTSDDVAAAYDRWGSARIALEAFEPLVTEAVEENRRRHAEWRARTRG